MGSSIPTGQPNGRPKKFKSVEELEVLIEKYFDRCDDNILQVYDKKLQEVITIEKPIPYMIEGLAAALGIDRKTLLNYQKDEEFFPVIRDAKRKILANQSEKAITGQSHAVFTMFLMKNNNDYSDKQEHEVNANVNLKGYDEFFTS